MKRLSLEFLESDVAPEGSNIELPFYASLAITPGIVHFGPGNFALAHIAAKTHELMQSGNEDALRYGIVTVSINSPNRRDQLLPQDCLYTIAEQDLDGKNRMTVVGSVVDAFFAPEYPADVVAQLASPVDTHR